MGFDFENIIYLLGIIIWILSSFFGKKKKIKPLGDKKIDPYTHDEKKIPKSFSDLVQQVKSELDKKDDVDRDIIINPDMDDLSQDEYIKDSHGELDKIITRGGPIHKDSSMANVRIPPGHPEGYLEGFAQIYTDAADIIQGSDKVSQLLDVLPNVDDGLHIMKFINASVQSSNNNSKWVTIE